MALATTICHYNINLLEKYNCLMKTKTHYKRNIYKNLEESYSFHQLLNRAEKNLHDCGSR